MIDDILLLAMVAVLAGAAVELRHGISDGLALIPVVQADSSIEPINAPISCASDEKVEAYSGYRMD